MVNLQLWNLIYFNAIFHYYINVFAIFLHGINTVLKAKNAKRALLDLMCT